MESEPQEYIEIYKMAVLIQGDGLSTLCGEEEAVAEGKLHRPPKLTFFISLGLEWISSGYKLFYKYNKCNEMFKCNLDKENT